MGNQTFTGLAALAYDPGGRLDRVTAYQAEPILLAQDFYQFLPDGRALTLTTFNRRGSWRLLMQEP